MPFVFGISFFEQLQQHQLTIQIFLQSWVVMADQPKQREKTEKQLGKGRKICAG